MSSKKLRMPSYGGQALIEGVLMRGKNSLSAAMRTPEGKIIVYSEKLQGPYKNKIFEIPLLRGLLILWDSLVVGMKYLTISANVQTDHDDEKIGGSGLFIAVIISISFAILIFFVLPVFITGFFSNIFKLNAIANNIFEGLLRLLMIIIYLWAISLMPEIKRVFAYHGAEHKTINAYEGNEKLNVSSVMKYSVQHPRCGTSFLLTLVIFSIIFFSFFGEIPFLIKLISRIIFIPIIAMFAYEFIRWLGNHLDNPIIRFISIPNMALQNLTTREPTPEMVEVAIKAFTSLIEFEKENTLENKNDS
jgi:uncharacterized protein YqhQ